MENFLLSCAVILTMLIIIFLSSVAAVTVVQYLGIWTVVYTGAAIFVICAIILLFKPKTPKTRAK